MPDLTFVIPIGPAHRHLAARAIKSAETQTVPCAVLSQIDEQQVGPGVLRNRLLAQVTTPFVSFLDADDWIEPDFAERTLAEYKHGGGNAYIFTDWFKPSGEVVETPCLSGPNGEVIGAPDKKPYCGGTWHPITTLLPTPWARAALFDEQLPAVEDTDFYLRLCTSFRCGHRLAVPLFHYTPGGGRAARFRESADYDNTMRLLTARYGGQMGCCGDTPNPPVPVGERQPGDVLAMALWHGNRQEYGRVTQRFYPRISMPSTAWVDPRDVAQSPELWRLVEMAPVDYTQGIYSLQQMANAGLASVNKSAAAAPAVTPVAPVKSPEPSLARVIRLSQKAVSPEPIFVFPAKAYPSYSDVQRLVTLAGYQSITINKLDAFSRQPYIVLSPEPLPDLDGARARIIAWQLEYAGDYTHNYDHFKGEVWASDKAWADAHGAKYVLMGSHEGLAEGKRSKRAKYDVSMLAYLTPRRQTLKDALGALRWPVDYPGHDTPERADVLNHTRLLLNVHQHDNAPYIAPQRIALAAAYYLPVICETVADPGDLSPAAIQYMDYTGIPALVAEKLASHAWLTLFGTALHHLLCEEFPFRRCVEEALK